MASPVAPLTIDELQHQPLFAGETREDLEWLLGYCAVQRLPADTLLLSPQHDNDFLYVLLDGRVRVQLDAQGQSVLAYLDTGDCFGEMSIIEGVPPSAVVTTHSPSTLLRVDGHALRTLLEQSQSLARNLLYILSARLRHDNLQIVHSLRQQQVFERHSKIDELTGLNNRRWMEQALPGLWQRSASSGRPLTLLMLDVDHFKRYNDSHGHLAGDRALTAVAAAVRAQLRPMDAAVRFGGEEFLVIIPDSSAAEGDAIAERLRQSVATQPVTHRDGTPLPPVTVSVGVACSRPGQTTEELLDAVDAALYRAKNAGRNCVRH
ncbi:MAG: GGDEF domain-containing protein [Gammaproteobacteria bacterium]